MIEPEALTYRQLEVCLEITQEQKLEWKQRAERAERWQAYVRTNHGLVAQSADAAMEIGWEPEHE